MPAKDDDIGKVVYCDNKFKVVRSRNNYVLININGEYHNHSHFKKESTCHLLMRIVRRKQLPRSPYLLEAARRISLDEGYINEIELKQRKRKSRYYNPQKGVRR